MILFVGLILVNTNPLDNLPGRDSGSFLYAGRQILQGGLPYVDFWDSKPPGIFYINAFGLLLGANTRWGVWLVEFFFLTLSSLFIYRGIEDRWGRGAALFSNILWLYGFYKVFEGGNLTEEYSLLFSFLALALFLKTDEIFNNKLPFLTGIALALGFLFRANNIGAQLSILITLFSFAIYKKQVFQLVKVFLLSSLGFMLPLSLVGIYFFQNSILHNLLEASILYNLYYSGEDFGNISLTTGLMNIGWPALIALFGYIFLIIQLLAPKSKIRLNVIHFFLLINFPIEIILSSVSGREYLHYYTSWMPAITALSAFTYHHLSSEFLSPKLRGALENPYKTLRYLLPILLIIYWQTGHFTDYQRIVKRLLFNRSAGVEKSAPIVNFLRDNTEKDENIYIWAARPDINFLSDRSSPTPYVFYPYYVSSPFTEKMQVEFDNDIIANKPAYIIDTSFGAIRTPFEIPSLNSKIREEQIQNFRSSPYALSDQEKFLDFIETNYQYIDTIDKYDIYLLTTPEE